jgi:hypothetical protein
VVDDLSAWVGWREDGDAVIAIEASCRIHITNHTGQHLRLLKARLNKAATTGTVEITGRGWSYAGASVMNGQYETLTVRFRDLPKNVLDGPSFTDFLMLTSDMTASYGVNVTFKNETHQSKRGIADHPE